MVKVKLNKNDFLQMLSEYDAFQATTTFSDVSGNIAAYDLSGNHFDKITEYYTKMNNLTKKVQTYIDTASDDVQNSQGLLLNEELYLNRVNPEKSTRSREVMLGIFPQLKPQSLSYLFAASIFMILMTIFLIFQMAGISGQINLPPSFIQWWVTPAQIPFYKNPMFLGGIALIATVAAGVFAYKAYTK